MIVISIQSVLKFPFTLLFFISVTHIYVKSYSKRHFYLFLLTNRLPVSSRFSQILPYWITYYYATILIRTYFTFLLYLFSKLLRTSLQKVIHSPIPRKLSSSRLSRYHYPSSVLFIQVHHHRPIYSKIFRHFGKKICYKR